MKVEAKKELIEKENIINELKDLKHKNDNLMKDLQQEKEKNQKKLVEEENIINQLNRGFKSEFDTDNQLSNKSPKSNKKTNRTKKKKNATEDYKEYQEKNAQLKTALDEKDSIIELLKEEVLKSRQIILENYFLLGKIK